MLNKDNVLSGSVILAHFMGVNKKGQVTLNIILYPHSTLRQAVYIVSQKTSCEESIPGSNCCFDFISSINFILLKLIY